jgi:hypothetical protein
MKSFLSVVASLAVATASGGDAPRLLRVELDTSGLATLPPTCFRTPATVPARAPASEHLGWVLRAGDERGGSLLELGGTSFVLGDAGPVVLPQQLHGSDARFSFQSFQARVQGASLLTRHTAADLVLTSREEGWTGTLTLSARDECRAGTCQLVCEVVLPFTATPVPLHLASAAR